MRVKTKMNDQTTFNFLLSLILVMAASIGLGAQEESKSSSIESIFSHPLERENDLEQLVGHWLELIQTETRTPQRELLLGLIAENLPQTENPVTFLKSLEELAKKESFSGLKGIRLRQLIHSLYRITQSEEKVLDHRVYPGLIRNWAVLGPVGLGLQGQYLRRFPPEESIDFNRKERGLRRDVSWVRAHTTEPRRVLEAIRFTRGGSGVYFYLAQVQAQEAVPAWVTFRNSHPMTLYVNGIRVALETFEENLNSTRTYEVDLRKGWNQILIKNLGGSFQALLTDRNGQSLGPKVKFEKELTLNPRAEGDSKRRDANKARSEVLTLGTWDQYKSECQCEDELKEPTKEALHRLAFAYIMLHKGSSPRSVEQIEKAQKILEENKDSFGKPLQAFIYYRVASLVESAYSLPSDYRQRQAKLAYENCLKNDGQFRPAHLQLAAYLLDDKQPSEANKKALLAQEGLTEPNLRVLKLQFNIFQNQNWEAQANVVADQIEKIAPYDRTPHLYKANRAYSRLNYQKALNHYSQAYKANPSSASSLERIAEIQSQLGDVEAALKTLAVWRERRPEKLSPLFALAVAEEKRGNLDKALEYLQEALKLYPLNVRALQSSAMLKELLGDREGALFLFRKVLEINPGNLRLAEYVRHLGGLDEDRFWEDHDESLTPWIEKIPSAENFPQADALAVLDIAVLRLYPDGSSQEYTHQAFKLLSDASKESLANMNTRGEILKLRTLTPKGEVLEPVNALGRGAYVMPGLEIGSIIEVAYRTRNSSSEAWRISNGPFYFQDFTYKQPFLLSRYVVILPKGLDLEIVEKGMKDRNPKLFATVTKTIEKRDDGTRVIVYETRSAPRLEPEIRMPSRDELIPNVRLIERRDWLEVAEFFKGSLLGIARPTPRLKTYLKTVLSELPEGATEGQKVKAIFTKVNDLIKSEQGPRSADGILLEKSGSRNVLFKALLDLAGITNHWVFARPREELAPAKELAIPGPEHFNHLLILVEAQGEEAAWVELNNRLAPYGKLPYYLQLGTALVLKPGGPTFRTLPGSDPEESAEELITKLALGKVKEDPLAAKVQTTLISKPQASYINKIRLKDIDAFRRGLILQQVGNQFFPGAKVEKGTFTEIEVPGKPFRVDIQLMAPRFLIPAKDTLLLKPVLQPMSMVRSFIRSPQRKHPYHFTAQVVRRDRLEVDLGGGYEEVRLPKNAVLTSALGSFSLSFERKGETLIIEREAHLRPTRLPADEFQDLLQFCKSIDRLESQRIVLKPRAK